MLAEANCIDAYGRPAERLPYPDNVIDFEMHRRRREAQH
jgi:hypothetical protein